VWEMFLKRTVLTSISLSYSEVKEMLFSEKPSKNKHYVKECAYVCPWNVLLDTALQRTLEVGHSLRQPVGGERLQLLENSEEFVVGTLILNKKLI
jgi:hypothetical protein